MKPHVSTDLRGTDFLSLNEASAKGLSRRDAAVLTVIITVGVCLRGLQLFWGIPSSAPPPGFTPSYHPDESKFYSSVLAFPEEYWSSRNFIYGTACQYLLGLLLLPWKFSAGPIDPVTAVLVSRMFVLVLGSIAIWLLYCLGRVVCDTRTGILAAALLAVSFLTVMNSAVATLDVPMSTLAILATLLSLKAAKSEHPRDWVLAGVACGLLLSTKVTGGLFLIVPVILSVRTNAPWPWLLVCAGVAAVTFALSTPHVVLQPLDYWTFMDDQRVSWLDVRQGSVRDFASVWATETALVAGWPVVVLAVCGLFWHPPIPRRVMAASLVYVASIYLFWRSNMSGRFIIPVVPWLCLFAAAACTRLLQARSRGVALLGRVIALFTVLHSTVLV
jgi:hypothetical protein